MTNHFSPLHIIFIITLCFLAGLFMAWGFQYIGGYEPCDLCYLQRWPYYGLISIGALLLFSEKKLHFIDKYPRMLLSLFMLIAIVSAGLGLYHAGVEWGFWQGPTSCSGGGGLNVNDIQFEMVLSDLETTRIVPCDKAAFRFLGLSFAGYNAVLSLCMAVYAALGLRCLKA